jgi:hypothetical protein
MGPRDGVLVSKGILHIFAGLHMYDEKRLLAKNLHGGWASFFDDVVFVFLLLERKTRKSCQLIHSDVMYRALN